MKKMLLISAVFAFLFIDYADAQNYAVGDGLVVAANSGLRLRIKPNISAPTIKVLEYGDPVTVQPMNDSSNAYADRIQWVDGHWVKIKTGLVSGWVFDGFLTGLVLPNRENQLCFPGDHIILPLENYIQDNFSQECTQDEAAFGEDISRFTSSYEGGIQITNTRGEGWYRSQILFEGRRMSEILNLMRTMLVGNDMRGEFEDALTFHQDRRGHLNKIEIKCFVFPVVIKQISAEYIEISSTIIDLATDSEQLANQ